MSRSGRSLQILFFYFFARIFGFLNGFFPAFFRYFGFPPVFLSFSTKKKFEIIFMQKTRFLLRKVTVLLPREARLCFSESHGHVFRKRKKCIFCFFFFRESHGFASARGTVVLSRESQPCLLGNEKNTRFLFFSFRESHGFASAGGTVVIS